MFKRIFINNQIRAREVRLIDKDGKQLGVLRLEDALRKAREAGRDLIQVTQKIDPPVCKIADYGKYAYQMKKKERKQKSQKIGELKSIRLRFNISPHDLETRAKTAEKFLKKGYKVRIEMVLRGREKYLSNFARQKLNQFLEILQNLIPIKVEREIKRETRGLTMIITRE
ncbi:translation initiation factor IF-3 [bacterium (Candidatus Gribaldobacteria) CG03_land_8_20_14_0_80_36_40]|uniref:Translation initiation factor IF-3 n=3 Tax=Candidatus Gribaldobacteria TaxID=2798536 RepID=A0A2M7VK20_9BACT|nr:MAG: translation initiation factor IF-3 [bacterium (Candidatus Gribaldobacteria) CG10_big_fil_rev_8_21_14_0_10_37_46]PIV14044.1 MAG: translation initiation factor IF-3 [bacterium (Candidatus Gribaldobacteria) CG03_land_8_20_14_0_80_36_40]PJA02009.1 MAG: translation initiation factor IF-3 [bacterium (Candidatus Gribaldobacteria) CG_4_10_14_0_2_um_filter_36_18]